MSQEQVQIEAIRALTEETPLNDFGMPTGIYRTDMLPFHDYIPKRIALGIVKETVVPSETEGSPDLQLANGEDKEYRIAGFPARALGAALMPLQYDEGYPAFDNGIPFWGRFEHEPVDAFIAFQEYLSMQRGRASNEKEDEYNGESASGLRSITELVTRNHPNETLVKTALYQGYYHLYYWGMRAHAYDLFRVAQHTKQQELRAVETVEEHYVLSRRLRHKLMSFFDGEDFMDLMTPKTAVDMLKTLTQMERVSAGLPAGGPASEGSNGKMGVTFEATLKSVSQTHRSEKGHTLTEDGEILEEVLKDPAATEVIQKLIIRSTGG